MQKTASAASAASSSSSSAVGAGPAVVGRAATLDELEALYERLQSSYAKLTVARFTLQGQPAEPADAGAQDPLIEAEHDSRLEEKEIDELHTGEMAGLGAKWEADAEAEEERLATARAAVIRLTSDLHNLKDESARLTALREELERVNGRARRLNDADMRRAALQSRRQRVAERQHRLEQQKQQNAEIKLNQERLKQELLAAKTDHARAVAVEEKITSQREAIIQLLL